MAILAAYSLAAEACAEIHARYASRGMSLGQVALCGAEGFVEWRHYPNRDATDYGSGYAFYYHAHSRNEMREGEHGHFHLFKRDRQYPGNFFHLIGIGLDQKGIPARIFTTNQWVTGETMVDAARVTEAMRHFDMVVKGRLAPLAKWLCAFNKLFHVEIEALINARDRKLDELEPIYSRRHILLTNRKYDVLSECEINLMCRISKYLTAQN